MESYVKGLNEINDVKRNELAELLAEKPKLMALMEKALKITSGDVIAPATSETPSAANDENLSDEQKAAKEKAEKEEARRKAKIIIVALLAGGTVGAALVTLPPIARAGFMGMVGAVYGYGKGKKWDEAKAEEKFVSEVTSLIDNAETTIATPPAGGGRVWEGAQITNLGSMMSEAELDELAEKIRTPLNMGFLAEHPNLLMRAQNVLRRIDAERYEEKMRNETADNLLNVLHHSLHKLQESREEVITELRKSEGKRKYILAALGGSVGAAAGYFWEEIRAFGGEKILGITPEGAGAPDVDTGGLTKAEVVAGGAVGAAGTDSLGTGSLTDRVTDLAPDGSVEVRGGFKLPEYLKINEGSNLGMSHTASADVIINEKVQAIYMDKVPALSEYADKFAEWKSGLAEHGNNLEKYADSLPPKEENLLREFAGEISKHNNLNL